MAEATGQAFPELDQGLATSLAAMEQGLENLDPRFELLWQPANRLAFDDLRAQLDTARNLVVERYREDFPGLVGHISPEAPQSPDILRLLAFCSVDVAKHVSDNHAVDRFMRLRDETVVAAHGVAVRGLIKWLEDLQGKITPGDPLAVKHNADWYGGQAAEWQPRIILRPSTTAGLAFRTPLVTGKDYAGEAIPVPQVDDDPEFYTSPETARGSLQVGREAVLRLVRSLVEEVREGAKSEDPARPTERTQKRVRAIKRILNECAMSWDEEGLGSEATAWLGAFRKPPSSVLPGYL